MNLYVPGFLNVWLVKKSLENLFVSVDALSVCLPVNDGNNDSDNRVNDGKSDRVLLVLDDRVNDRAGRIEQSLVLTSLVSPDRNTNIKLTSLTVKLLLAVEWFMGRCEKASFVLFVVYNLAVN